MDSLSAHSSTDGGPAAAAATAPARPRVSLRSRAWNDAPLATKVLTLAMSAAVAGVGLGMLEARLGHRGWPLALGMAALTAALVMLGRPLIWGPFDRLLTAWRRLRQDRVPGAIERLPTGRSDEVGQVARALYQLSLHAIRNSYEARQLRRTLDHRIAQATRLATARLRHLAMRDPLTDLGNRRFLDESLEPLVNSVLASGRTLAALIIDLDRFKSVNDELGHAAGDQLLVALAGLLRANIRREDYAVRLGGDEFLVLLPDTSWPRVMQLTTRLRMLFCQHARAHVPGLDVDLSIGVAYLPGAQTQDGITLLAEADAALYAAKRTGRGRVVGA